MSPESSPEEKLLRLIRGERPDRTPKASVAQPVLKAEPSPTMNYDVISRKEAHLNRDRFRLVNTFLILACLVSAGFAFYDVVSRKSQDHKLPVRYVDTLSRQTVPEAVPIQKQDPSAFLQLLTNRELFQPPAPEETPVIKPEKTVFLKDLSASLSLMGVVEGDPNQAIIQDSKSEKTYFLNKGDLLGELRIKDVKPGVAILEFDGEEAELRF